MSAQSLAILPDFVKQGLSEIMQKTGISQETLVKEYIDRINDPWVTKDPQFKTDEERARYCIGIMTSRHINMPPVKEHTIIVLGFEKKRLTKANVPRRNMFVADRELAGIKKRRLVLQDTMSDIVLDVPLFAYYPKILLGQFQNGDLTADKRSSFVNPEIRRDDPMVLFEKILGTPRTTINQIYTEKEQCMVKDQQGRDVPTMRLRNAAKFDGKYIDSLDWRIIRGYVLDAKKGIGKDGIPWGQYIIGDDSIKNEIVEQDGIVRSPSITGWTSPELVVYAIDSECDFVGYLQEDKERKISFNVVSVVPVHARELVK